MTPMPVEVTEHIQHTDDMSRVVVIFSDRPPVTKTIGDIVIAEEVAEFAARHPAAVCVHLVIPAPDPIEDEPEPVRTERAFMIDDREMA